MKRRILGEIQRGGPLAFDRYMELCLYDPADGFFAAGPVRSGREADFITSPEVSPWFGRLLGRWAAGEAHDGSVLIEVGSGSGSLLEPLSVEVGERFSSVVSVERSAEARRLVADRLPQATTVAAFDDVATADHAVIVMNEVLDNVPSRLVERTRSQWVELCVDAQVGELTLSATRADEDLAGWCDEYLGDVPDGAVLAAQTAVGPMLEDLARRFEASVVCVVDYGGPTGELASRRRSDVVRTFSGQRTGRNPLEAPGSADVTLEVNTDVVRRAVERGGGTLETTRQRDFLLRIGAGPELDRLDRLQHEHARRGAVMDQLVARSEANDLRALLDPDGLGGFAVMIARWGT